jgi:hypothetical protein
MIRRSTVVSALLIAGSWAATTASAQPKPDPDWPCVQRKVVTLTAGTIWSGPNPEEAGPWGSDFEAAALAQKLASRRTPLSDIEGLVAAFAAEAGPDKSQRLTRTFAGALELINTERQRIISGIERYARGQRGLAERIRDEADRITAVKDSPAAVTPKEFEELETRFAWDKRIFDERSQALQYVCETPVLLEQRLFEIARQLQARLS